MILKIKGFWLYFWVNADSSLFGGFEEFEKFRVVAVQNSSDFAGCTINN